MYYQTIVFILLSIGSKIVLGGDKMPLKIVIAGSRDYHDYEEAKPFIESTLSSLQVSEDPLILSGACRGADQLGERYAEEKGYPLLRFRADWANYGRTAGPIRNREMVRQCDVVICFWDGKSKGTHSLIRCAESLKKHLFIKRI